MKERATLKGVLVTGAGVRIGRALAMALAEDGYFVFVHHNRSADRAPTATAAAFDKHMAINLRAPMLIGQALARQLPRDEVGLIVNLEDQKLFNLNPDFLTYTLSKMGLHGLTHMLAQALAPRLRVMGIAPGLTLQGLHQTPERF